MLRFGMILATILGAALTTALHRPFQQFYATCIAEESNSKDITCGNATNQFLVKFTDENDVSKITDLTLKAFKDPKIQKDTFSKFTGMKRIYVWEGNVEIIGEDSFEDLPELDYVSLRQNHIKRVPKNMLVKTQVLRLFLDGNAPLDIPAEGSVLSSPLLRQLHLSSCGISCLFRDSFTDLPHLALLYLDHNNLQTLPEDLFRNNHKLHHLALYGNQLTTLSQDTFRLFKAPATFTFDLYLKDNPWDCSCDKLGRFYNWAKSDFEANIRFKGLGDNNLRCYAPINGTGWEKTLDQCSADIETTNL